MTYKTASQTNCGIVLCIRVLHIFAVANIYIINYSLSLLLHKCIRRSKSRHAYLEVNIVFPNRKFNQTLYVMVTNTSLSVVGTEDSLVVQ